MGVNILKNKKTILIALGTALLGLIVYNVFIELNKSSVTVEEKTAVTETEDGEEIEETVIEIDEIRDVPIEEELPNDMSENALRQAIHDMSHQKVRADKKWGFLPLTQERVERLIEIIEKNEGDYENANVYLNILKRWEKNDFTKVDKDHNIIWNMQSGTIGRAYGIMSAEEERAFIKKHFNIVEKEVTSE